MAGGGKDRGVQGSGKREIKCREADGAGWAKDEDARSVCAGGRAGLCESWEGGGEERGGEVAVGEEGLVGCEG